MVIPKIMFVTIKSASQKPGLYIYIIGSIFYNLSWIAIIVSAESSWSLSALGFTAPAYTAIIWFAGIGLIGEKSFFKINNSEN